MKLKVLLGQQKSLFPIIFQMLPQPEMVQKAHKPGNESQTLVEVEWGAVGTRYPEMGR